MKKIIVPIFIIFLISCQKNGELIDDNTTNNDTNSLLLEVLNESALVNQIFQDVVNNSGDAVLKAEGSFTGKSNNLKSSPTIVIEPFDFDTFPKTITVDFGSGILCKDGVTRKGVITVVSSGGWYGQEGSTHTTTFNNYYHDIFKVEGTQIVENLGKNENNQLEYFVSVDEGRVSIDNEISIEYSEGTFRVWTAGSDTPLNIWDDEYLLEGGQSGIASDGSIYYLTIEEPLHFVLLPRDIKSGIIDMEIGGISDIKLNYNNRTTTIFGETFPWN